jgi:5-carboxymethyl-2-hydroxymuconate isomerase
MLREALRDTWAYQEMIKEGREEARRETLRDMLFAIVRARFPELVLLAKGLAAVIESPDVLRDLTLKMSLVQTSEDAQAALVEVSKENSNV